MLCSPSSALWDHPHPTWFRVCNTVWHSRQQMVMPPMHVNVAHDDWHRRRARGELEREARRRCLDAIAQAPTSPLQRQLHCRPPGRKTWLKSQRRLLRPEAGESKDNRGPQATKRRHMHALCSSARIFVQIDLRGLVEVALGDFESAESCGHERVDRGAE
jgi:hypothetical protein